MTRPDDAALTRRAFLQTGARWAAGGACASLWAPPLSRAQTPNPTAARPRVILVWSEATAPQDVYPRDINGAVAESLAKLRGWEVRTAGINDPEQGIGPAQLEGVDVLVWWGHRKHGQIPDATVARIVARVKENGMGFVALHSSHFAKPLKAVLGASGSWKAYTNDGKPHRITVADPRHPIARGVRPFVIPKEERYEEPFDVPTPEAVVLGGVHEANGNTARQGLTWTIGKGRVFYFRPGHETYPVYFQPEVRRVLRNAVLWAGRDEAGIWEDNDPAALAARAAKEPPLAVVLQRLGYGQTDVTPDGEVATSHFSKAGPGPITHRPLAAWGLLKTCSAGWYAPGTKNKAEPQRTPLWQVNGPDNKQDNPPLMPGARTTFDPGANPFGLWVATRGFPGETVYTDDALQALITRFKSNRHKAHVYPAVKNDGTPATDAYVIGWEYSTNDDNQDLVTLVENVRPAPTKS